jgi:hypothetical protein
VGLFLGILEGFHAHGTQTTGLDDQIIHLGRGELEPHTEVIVEPDPRIILFSLMVVGRTPRLVAIPPAGLALVVTASTVRV